MNDPMATPVHTEPHRSNRAPRKQDRSSLRRDHQTKSAFDWEPQKRSFREMVLYWRDLGRRLYSTLTKPRLPQGYYAFIENLNLRRWEAIFLIVMVLVSGRMSFNATTNLMNDMPEVEIITPAQANESVQSNKYKKTDKDGFFLEDCY